MSGRVHWSVCLLLLWTGRCLSQQTNSSCVEQCVNHNVSHFECVASGCRRFPLDEIDWPPGVTSVNVRQNNLTELPVLDLPELTDIDMSRNNISIIQNNAFKDCSKLRHVNLSRNAICGLSGDWKITTNTLQVFDLSRNKISEIDDNFFFYLDGLTVLDLSENSIHELDMTSLFGLNVLLSLDLNRNKLSRLESFYFPGLSKLQYLSVRQNQVREIDDNTFQGLDNLRTLDLGQNQLHNLSRRMFHDAVRHVFSQLQAIHLDDNNLAELPERTFSPCLRLEYVFLDRNPIGKIAPDKQFPESLRIFSMRQNTEIRKLRNGTFTGLPRLEKVDLSGCHHLMEIEAGTFDGLRSSVDRLDLSQAGMYSVSSQLVDWAGLGLVRLAGNPWSCDCHLAWMQDVLPANITNTVRCRYPYHLKGRTMSSLSSSELECTYFTNYNHRIAAGLVFAATVLLVIGITVLLLSYRKKIPCRKPKGDYQTLFETADDAEDPSVSIQWEKGDSETSALKESPEPTPV